MPEAAAGIKWDGHSKVTVCISVCTVCVCALKWSISGRDDRMLVKEINCEKVRMCRGGEGLGQTPPLLLSLPLFIHPPSCLSEAAEAKPHPCRPFWPHRNTLCRAFCCLTFLCHDAATRSSSVDKLPPFFTTTALSSNALTQNPCALLSDNKNNHQALGMRDVKRVGKGKWAGA